MKWFVVIAALLSASLASHVEGSEEVEPLALGSPAPDFDLPGVDGKNYRLKDFSNAEILVVIFTCNHCPTAQAYEERIKKLVSDYKGKAVAFVAISPNDPLAVRLDELGYADVSDSFEENKIRARDHAFNFPYLYDGDKQEVAKAYGPARRLTFSSLTDSESSAIEARLMIPKEYSGPRGTTSGMLWMRCCPANRFSSATHPHLAARLSGQASAIQSKTG